jgi:hypothetical protein
LGRRLLRRSWKRANARSVGNRTPRYLDCPHRDFAGIRERAHKLQLDAMDKIKTNLPRGKVHLARFAHGIVRSAWNSPVDPERLWLGTWNLDTLWRLCIGPDHSFTIDEAISSDELMQLRTIVKNVTQPLILAVRELWVARGAILHPKVLLPSSSLTRLNFPTRDRRKSSKGKAPTQDESRSHRIDEYTESLAPLPQEHQTQAYSIQLRLRAPPQGRYSEIPYNLHQLYWQT